MRLYTLIICLLAGLGAGLGTGFAGLSAAAVISPMLITFLHMPAYTAEGVAARGGPAPSPPGSTAGTATSTCATA